MLILYQFNCPLFSFIMSFVRCTERTCAIKHNILFFSNALQGTNHIIHIHVQKRINTFHFYIYYYLYICYICISIEKKICAFYFGFGPKGCLKSINFVNLEFITICSSKVNSKYFRRINISSISYQSKSISKLSFMNILSNKIKMKSMEFLRFNFYQEKRKKR